MKFAFIYENFKDENLCYNEEKKDSVSKYSFLFLRAAFKQTLFWDYVFSGYQMVGRKEVLWPFP